MNEITIIKNNAIGEEVFRYKGQLIEQKDNTMIIEAIFTLHDRIHFGMPIFKGDHFIETYFSDQWYNIFEIHARETGELRGWYCNITTPAIFTPDTIAYNDLALDLLVFPDGKQLVLDKDEFAELQITKQVRENAIAALQTLKASFEKKFRDRT